MRTRLVCGILFVVVTLATTAGAQSNAFTYQGRLTDNTVAAGGTYEMQFRVFDAAVAGNQLPVGTPVTLNFTVAGTNPVTVSNGAFTVQLNFGAGVFTGADRWLEISVRKPSDPPGYTLLAPRQQITSSPYSIKTVSATWADGISANCIGCVTDSQINSVSGSKVTGTIAIANGGTGGATAQEARTNLGLGTLATASPTGTASAATFLRGDNTWITPPTGGAIVDLIARNTASQSLASGAGQPTPDDVSFGNELTSPSIPGASWSGTTYNVGQTGFYLISVHLLQTGTLSGAAPLPQLLVNGSTVLYGVGASSANSPTGTFGRGTLTAVIFLTAGQDVKIKAVNQATVSMPLSTNGSTRIMIVKL